MLKKVAGAAQNRLRQQFHHHHGPQGGPARGPAARQSSHGNRPHPHTKTTAMSFSSVDNDAFEQILDDQSEFDIVASASSTPPSSSPSTTPRGANIARPPTASTPPSSSPSTTPRGANIARPPTASQNSDLFDTDMFVMVDEEGAGESGHNNLTPQTGTHDPLTSAGTLSSQGVNCDPLSGQIVSEVVPVADNDSRTKTQNETGERLEIQESLGRTETQNVDGNEIRNETVERTGIQNETVNGTEIQTETGGALHSNNSSTTSQNLNPEVLSTAESGNVPELTPAALATNNDTLFDQDYTPPAAPTELTQPSAANSLPDILFDEDQVPEPAVTGLAIPRTDDSPLSSLPSSFEADPGHFGSGGARAIAINRRPGESALAHADSSVSDLEAELEELLAPRAKSHSLTSNSSDVSSAQQQLPRSLEEASAAHHPSGSPASQPRTNTSSGSSAHQSHPSADREGSHLDSGVFENDGRELDSALEREREREGGAERGMPAQSGERDFEIHEDHFTGSAGAAGRKSVDQTTFTTASDDNSSRKSTGSTSRANSSKPVRSLTPTAGRKNSAGKLPPPRPKPPSPQLQARAKSKTSTSAATVVSATTTTAPRRPLSGLVTSTADGKGGEVTTKLVQPLGRVVEHTKPSLGASNGEGGVKSSEGGVKLSDGGVKLSEGGIKLTAGGGVKLSEGELSSDDDLFPNDVKRLEETRIQQHESTTAVGAAPPTFPVYTSTEDVIVTKPEGEASLSESATVPRVDQSETPQESETRLTLPYHLLLTLLLYLYYSLNFSAYVAGFFAGFLMLYMLLGAVFVYYVHYIEREREEGKLEMESGVSDEFLKTMKVDFNKLKIYHSTKFTATLSYNSATHHPSQRMRAELKLNEDFKFFVQVTDSDHISRLCQMVDIRQCRVSIEPKEVAQNRKRRWSKKFPFVISHPTPPKKFKVYLFACTAREKEDWFRRLRSAASGQTSEQVIQTQWQFFKYMQKYFSEDMLKSTVLEPALAARGARNRYHPQHQVHTAAARSNSTAHRVANTSVQFTKSADSDENTPSEDSAVNITRKSGSAHGVNHTPPAHPRRAHSSDSNNSSGSGNNNVVGFKVHDSNADSANSLPSLDEHGFEHVQYPVPAPASSSRTNRQHRKTTGAAEDKPNQWLNSLAARLCWDVWHEQRWKNWIKTRIEKKVNRIKTPSFMESLRLTNIDIGNDMPMVNRLVAGPRLDLRGIWVYLDVTYQGKFVMTIETKMKLGGGGTGAGEEGGQQMSAMARSGIPVTSPLTNSTHRSKSSRPLSHTQAAHALAGGVSGKGSSVDPEDEIDSGSDEEEGSGQHHPLLESEFTSSQIHELDPQNHTSPAAEQASPPVATNHAPNDSRLKSMVKRVAKKVVSTKIVQRAAEKVSSYSLVLTVEVNKLEGILVVNIPPPPTDTIWWGFYDSPKLELVAKPRLGNREVKLSKVTHWIERKLRDLVDKKLKYPEMEDLVIPVLNSGMPEDIQKPISSDSSQHATS